MIDVTETIARAIWEGREKTLPERVRMTWEQGTDAARSSTLAHAAASITALEAAGYAIVPIEPTEAMWDAAMREGYDQDPSTYYRAMINTGKAKP